MSTIAGSANRLRELDEEMRQAWDAYHDSTRLLAGEEYEETELIAWSVLQDELHQLERRRRLAGAAA